MAISLNNRYVPGAPGTYVNERAGVIGLPAGARHDTCYVMVEAPAAAPITRFPYNSPVAITSLADYRELVGGSAPTERIPHLCYKWVEVFFRNSAGGGDLRVIRVGTPNIISEIEILPSASKVNESGIPSPLNSGDRVYIQMTLNGNRLVSGEGEFSYTSSGEYLGVPVTIPVDYIEGDASNNRQISYAISKAIADAINSNPNLRGSVYVRDFGRTVDLKPEGESETAYVVVAGASFDSSISVVTLSNPLGANYALTTSGYSVSQANGQQSSILRVPQDYIQCIDTALEGQLDQGYLFAPSAFAQFDAEGRAAVGQAMATAVQAPALRWAAVADAGPYLVTDINKYRTMVPHKAAQDLLTGFNYLVDNAIYEWTGPAVTFPKLTYQKILPGSSPRTAIEQSNTPAVSPKERVGLVDNFKYRVYSPTVNSFGRLVIDSTNYWPVDLSVQRVLIGAADGVSNPFSEVPSDLFVVAPPYDTSENDYSDNVIFFAPNASSANAVYDYVLSVGGSKNVSQLPPGAINIPANPKVYSCEISYEAGIFDLEVTINGQKSDLIENISDRTYGINTQNLPATLQDPTQVFNLGLFSRMFKNPSALGEGNGGIYRGDVNGAFPNNAIFDCAAHGLSDGTKIFFNKEILTSGGRLLIGKTTRRIQTPYFVKVVDANHFVLAASLTNFSAGSYISLGTAETVLTSTPVIAYSGVLAGSESSNTSGLNAIDSLALIRGRKYGFDSSSIYDQVSSSSAPPTNDPKNRNLSIGLSRSSSILGEGTVSPIGETPNAGYLPGLELLTPPVAATSLTRLYGNNGAIAGVAPNFVTRDSQGLATAINDLGDITKAGFFKIGYQYVIRTAGTTDFTEVGAADSDPGTRFVATAPGSGTGDAYTQLGIEPSSKGYWNVIGEALMFLPPVWVENNGESATLTWEWKVDGVAVGALDNKVAVLTSELGMVGGEVITVSWSLEDTQNIVTGNTPATAAFLTAASLSSENYSLAGDTQVSILNPEEGFYVGRVVAYSAAMPTALADATEPSSRVTEVFSYGGQILHPLGNDPRSLAAKSADSGHFQLHAVTNGTYPKIRTTLVINSKNLVNEVVATTPVGPLQAFAVSTWSNSTVPIPSTWDIALAGLDVSFFGPQNFLCIPTVEKTFDTESFLVPQFPCYRGGLLNAFTSQISGVGVGSYANLVGLENGSLPTSPLVLEGLVGVYLEVTHTGNLPDELGGGTVLAGQYLVVSENNGMFSWQVVNSLSQLSSFSVPLWGSRVKISYRNQETPPPHLWRFDAITPLELIEEALQGINSNGVAQAKFLERGIDSPSTLLEDSQRYFDAQGFISYDGPWLRRVGGDAVPLSSYRAGIIVRSMRERGLHFPAAGTRYALTDAVAPQIEINSTHQNTMNLKGCNVARTLPGYPSNTVFLWGARTRVNTQDGDQGQYRFMNTRVIMNVAYGIMRSVFDSQIFTVAEGFNVLSDKIVSTGNSALYPLYADGILFGDRPKDAFRVICDARINDYTNLEDGIVFVEAFVAPSPTIERISVGLVRVAIGQMNETLQASGLGTSFD
jgi:hypothetical protein